MSSIKARVFVNERKIPLKAVDQKGLATSGSTLLSLPLQGGFPGDTIEYLRRVC
jgi:hypothetical protein